ncbi:MAG: hypothetical protein CMM58_00880 [Rhodospirillaceae bacterium]|nr:hypothetical protein [Rhodospirillaceae bacterium]|tara:strand:- start:7653 stop:8957 length:1305 start_codon:yes stop_codon:yes gene_type:complete
MKRLIATQQFIVRQLALFGAMLFLVHTTVSQASSPITEQNTFAIAAIVNDKIITIRDLRNRVRLVTAISKINVNAKNSNRLHKQVLWQLIDEELEQQEINRLQITISRKEINAAKSMMERRFNVPKGKLNEFITAKNIDKADAISQLKTSLGWTRAVRRRFINHLKINDDEIDLIIKKVKDNIGKPQFNVSEILIPINDLNNERRAKELAEKLYGDLKRGANFNQIARGFSAAATAINNGKMGWILSGQLSPVLDDPLKILEKGQITKPIKTQNGYYLLKLHDRRLLLKFDPSKIRVTLLQMLIQTSLESANSEMLITPKIRGLLSKVTTCGQLKKVSTNIENASIRELGQFYMGELSSELKVLISNSKVGVPTTPVRIEEGTSILSVCNRITPPSNIPSRAEVERRLQREKLENLARKYLRDLRRDAFIEIRI